MSALVFATSSSGAGQGLGLPLDAIGWVGTAELFAWAGFSAELTAVVTPALGPSPSISALGFLNEHDINSFLSTCQVDDGSGKDRAANLGEKSAFRKAWSAARLLTGQASPPSLGGLPTAVGPAAKRVKLSSLVDVTAEAELIPLSPEVVRDMFDKYSTERGEPPAPDVEPTGEQLGAVKQLVDSGAPPYVDFALFGPHGRRLLKKLTYTESCYNPSTGEWSKRELPGPSDISSWMRSWAVLECTLLLLGIVKAERLRNYLDRITHFCSLYGPQCWPIIYQADSRMRCEHFERLRRQLESHYSYYKKIPGAHTPPGFSFDPSSPWDAVFGAASRDEAFWTAEVKDKCILFLSRLAPAHSLLSAGTTIDPPANLTGFSTKPGPNSHPAQQSRQQKRRANKGGGRGNAPIPPAHPKGGGKSSPKGAKGKGASSGGRADNTVCQNFNAGRCDTPFKYGRRHECSKCGGTHALTACTQQRG